MSTKRNIRQGTIFIVLVSFLFARQAHGIPNQVSIFTNESNPEASFVTVTPPASVEIKISVFDAQYRPIGNGVLLPNEGAKRINHQPVSDGLVYVEATNQDKGIFWNSVGQTIHRFKSPWAETLEKLCFTIAGVVTGIITAIVISKYTTRAERLRKKSRFKHLLNLVFQNANSLAVLGHPMPEVCLLDERLQFDCFEENKHSEISTLIADYQAVCLRVKAEALSAPNIAPELSKLASRLKNL